MTDCTSWLPGNLKVTSKLGSTMSGVLLNGGRNVRKHADQMRSRIENDQFDSSVEMNSDDDDLLEMRVIERQCHNRVKG